MIQTLLKYIGKHHLMPTVFRYIIHQNRLIKTQAFREIHLKKKDPICTALFTKQED